MFPPWPSCLGGPGAPCRGPAVLIVATLRVRGKVTAPGQRRALPTPPGRALELLPPQMPRPARPGPEAWSEPLRKAVLTCAECDPQRHAESTALRPPAQASMHRSAGGSRGQLGAKGPFPTALATKALEGRAAV